MNILFANEYFLPFAPGGAEWSLYYWTLRLARLGHKITIITPDLSDGSSEINYETDKELLATGNVTIHRFPFRAVMPDSPRVFPSYIFGNPFFNKYFRGRIVKSAIAMKAEIIVAHGFDSICPVYEAGNMLNIGAIAVIRDYRALCPISICLHKEQFAPKKCTFSDFARCVGVYNGDYDFYPDSFKRMKMWVRRFLEWRNTANVRRVLPLLDGAVFVSDGIRKIYSACDILPEKHEVIYNPGPKYQKTIEPEKVVARYNLKGKKVLLFVGRFSIGKGAKVITEGMSYITKAAPDAILVVAGNKEYKSKNKNIIFTGHLEKDELASLYKISKMVVLPSRWPEPLSRVLLEAAYFTVPVVATKTGGNPEIIIDGLNGFLTERNNPSDFAGGCLKMLKMKDDDYKKMKTKIGKVLTMKFDIEKLTEKLETFYSGIIEAKR